MADTVYKFVDINGNEIEENLHCIPEKHGLMCPEDKTKLRGIEEGATKTIIDAILSDTSTNPVQNKIVTTALSEKPEAFFMTANSGGDGTEWTQSNITNINFNCIYYANGIWVAGSSGYGLYYSLDGKTWTQSNITSNWYYIVYNANGIWVAGTGSNDNKGLYYSTDGKTWTQSNITSKDFKCVYYANGIWVASVTSTGLYYSLDGKTWTQSNINSNNFYCVYYANGIWVACSSSKGLYYSLDGKTWTQSNITSKDFKCVYYANGIWIAGSYSNNGLYYSIDGKTWTQSNITSGIFYSVYNANGIWVAGSDSNGLYYSIDGKTWTQSNITNISFYCVYNANGIWVAGSWSKGLYYSIDGKSWTLSNITNISFTCVYNGNGIWVAGSYGLYYSESSSIDKTVDELLASYNNGDLLFCKVDSNILPLVYVNDTTDPRFIFAGTNNTEALSVSVNSDNTAITLSYKLQEYTHPASHPATMITQDSTHRFVTDTEKTTWNNKAAKDLSNVDNSTFKAKVEASGFSSGTQVQILTWESSDGGGLV